MLQIYLAMVNGDEEKSLVEFLYTQYRQLMFKTALSVLHNNQDAEDAVHSAFLRIINNLSKFAAYSCNENVAYLVIVVRGISLDMLAARKKTAELDEELPSADDVAATTEKRLSVQTVMKNIEKLTPALKNVATLHFAEQLTADEISKLLDMNISTVRSSISRARAVLRGMREEDSDE